ncbi:hypothetical protein [Streptomyces hyaluromycini]|uniref:hypothetical protein n=1 Tax=Streptomyces hyaluromycini TaxID=1377993 RepID=UPI000B5C5549
MPLPYVYRVTKYVPADRDEHGHYTGAEDTVSDHGEIEAACLRAVEAFAVETGGAQELVNRARRTLGLTGPCPG